MVILSNSNSDFDAHLTNVTSTEIYSSLACYINKVKIWLLLQNVYATFKYRSDFSESVRFSIFWENISTPRDVYRMWTWTRGTWWHGDTAPIRWHVTHLLQEFWWKALIMLWVLFSPFPTSSFLVNNKYYLENISSVCYQEHSAQWAARSAGVTNINVGHTGPLYNFNINYR